MKYLVMECHEGYAVLMDEDSSFVHAANLHYSVGQTVTDPVLLNEREKRPVISHSIVMKLTAAAACLLLCSAVGTRYYSRNLKTQARMLIGSDLQIEMKLNSRGEVLKMESDTENGQKILENYSGKKKDSVTAINELLSIMKEQGYIAEGDTLDLYISAEDDKTYTSYKNEIEQEISEPKLNVQDIEKLDKHDKPAPPTGPAEPPKPPAADGNDENKPPSPGEGSRPTPGTERPEAPKPGEGPGTEIGEPPKPPIPPEGEKPGIAPGVGTETAPPPPDHEAEGTEPPKPPVHPLPHEKGLPAKHMAEPPVKPDDDTHEAPAADSEEEEPAEPQTPAAEEPTEIDEHISPAEDIDVPVPVSDEAASEHPINEDKNI